MKNMLHHFHFRSRKSDKRDKRKLLKRSREWIEAKKDRARMHGKYVAYYLNLLISRSITPCFFLIIANHLKI